MVKKRYHQSKRDRMHESHGMHKHMMKEHHSHHAHGHHQMGHAKYDGPEMRRHMEMMDGGMIREDHSAIANLPQGVMMKPYPMTGPYMPEGLDDTIRGVDKQMDSDDSQRARHFNPHKY
jgi:hypothetical protein